METESVENPFGLVTNQPDPTPELEKFDAIDLPYSWFERLSAQASEALPEQWRRNKLMLRNYTWQAIEAMDSIGEEPDLGEVIDTSTTIKTAAELNEQYKTDIFKLPMADFLAPDYIKNHQARQANQYILEHDGGTGFGTTLLGSIPGIVEPVNFVTTALMGPLTKGAKAAQALAAVSAESVISTGIAMKGAEVGAGVEYTGAELAANVALGTAFGMGAHALATKPWKKMDAAKNVQDPTNPTLKEATQLGNAVEGVKTPAQAIADEVTTRAPIELRNAANAAIEAIAPSTGRISRAEIAESLLPKVKPESIEAINKELADATSSLPEDSLVVFNKMHDLLEGVDEGNPVLGESFATRVEDGAKTSFAKGEQALEARFIAKKNILEVDSIDPRTQELPETLGKIFKSLTKEEQATIKTSDLVSGLLNPKVQAQALKELSEMSGGKAVKYRETITDFTGVVSEAPAVTRQFEPSELDMPKGDADILKKVRPDEAFQKPTDMQVAEDFMKLPEIDYDPKLTNINSVIDEVQSGIDEKVKSGFFKKESLEILEDMKEEEKTFKALEQLQQAYIYCTRGE